MCPKLIELLSWNGPTVHVCWFMLVRAHPLKHSLAESIFVSLVQKNSEKIFVSRKIRQQGHSLAEVSLCVTDGGRTDQTVDHALLREDLFEVREVKRIGVAIIVTLHHDTSYFVVALLNISYDKVFIGTGCVFRNTMISPSGHVKGDTCAEFVSWQRFLNDVEAS